jgi:hypothetical protein
LYDHGRPESRESLSRVEPIYIDKCVRVRLGYLSLDALGGANEVSHIGEIE